MKTALKVGDTVKVIAGNKKDLGKTGRVLEIDRESGRVRVEGVRTITRHLAPQKNPRHPEGGKVESAGTIHISNVMLFSEALSRPVRTGRTKDTAGKKIRVARGRNIKAV